MFAVGNLAYLAMAVFVWRGAASVPSPSPDDRVTGIGEPGRRPGMHLEVAGFERSSHADSDGARWR